LGRQASQASFKIIAQGLLSNFHNYLQVNCPLLCKLKHYLSTTLANLRQLAVNSSRLHGTPPKRLPALCQKTVESIFPGQDFEGFYRDHGKKSKKGTIES